MDCRHPGRVCTRESAFLDFADGFLKCGSRWIAVTRVNESLLLATEDLIDLLHRLVGERRRSVDRSGDRLRLRQRASFACVYEFRCDIAFHDHILAADSRG